MMESISLETRPRGKPIKTLPEHISCSAQSSAADLYTQIAQQTKYSVHQLRITKGSDGTVVPNSKDVALTTTGLRDQSTIFVKDLGPQIGWRTVFIIEYLGPILIHPLVYTLRPYIYSSAPSGASQLQTATCALIVLHFIKRELETIYVHRFSAATMPIMNIFKNCFHYWVLAGLNIAPWIYAPSSSTAQDWPIAMPLGIPIYLLGEVGNLNVHLTLRGLRSSGGTERGIPQGPLFDLVTCPNYLTETISWIGVYIVSGFHWSILLFALVSVAQMAQWSKKKESRYRKEFGDKYKKKRYTMLPGVW